MTPDERVIWVPLATLGEWWCALNGWQTPQGVPRLTPECKAELFDYLNRYSRVKASGAAIWNDRVQRGLDPVFGFGEESRRGRRVQKWHASHDA